LSHHILKTKTPFTLTEKVIEPALQIAAEQVLDKETERKLQNKHLCPILTGISYGRRFIATTF